MSKIVDNYVFYRNRKNIEIHHKFNTKNHLSNESKEKLYSYYVCDYCSSEIIIKEKRTEMTGGILEVPYSLTGKAPITLVLCNRCLKPVLDEFEKERSGENHIPRIN